MPKKILLADDSITIQKVISLTFATEDYELVIVGDGESAIEKAREIKPDLIMADVSMPGKNGYEVCEAVKNDPDLKHIPVLLLAGTFEPLKQEEAERVGADDHIVKPFESQELLDKVKDLLSKTIATEAEAMGEAVQPPEEQPPEKPSEVPEEIWEAGDFLGTVEETGESISVDESLKVDEDFLGGEFLDESQKEEEALEEEFVDLKLDEELEPQETPAVSEPAGLETEEQVEHPTPEPFQAEKEPHPEKEPPKEQDLGVQQAEETLEFAETVEPLEEIAPEPQEPQVEAQPQAEEAQFPIEEPAEKAVEEETVAEESVVEIPPEAPVEEPYQPSQPSEEAPSVEEKAPPVGEVQPPEVVPEREAPGYTADIEGIEEKIKEIVERRLEGISKERIEEIVTNVTREVVEEILWNVIPDIAEQLIKAEIEKLKEALSRIKQ